MDISTLSAEYTDSLIDLAIKMSRKPEKRNRVLVGSLICTIISSFGVTYANYHSGLKYIDTLKWFSVVIAVISATLVFASLLSFTVKDKKTVSEQIEELNRANGELIKKVEENKNITDIVKLNLSQLNEYYHINKIQAKRSYNFAVLTITVGLVLLVVGIGYGMIWSSNYSVGSLVSLGGLVSEFVGLSSLHLYKENSKQITLFYGKLTYLQRIMLAVDLSSDMDQATRNEQKSKIIDSLINEV